MDPINPGGPGIPNLPPGGASLTGQDPVTGADGSQTINPTDARILAEMQQLLASLGVGGGAGGVSGVKGQDDPVTDARGAPSIGAPSTSVSADDLVDLLRSLQTKSLDAQLATAKSGVESAQVKAKKNTEAQLAKIKEWVDKSEKAAHKGLLGKIFGWIGKIVAVIAAVAAVAVAAVATVASGGAAAPLLALAAVGLVAATISLADQISKSAGGPEISIGKLLTTMTSKFLQACGVPEEKAEAIGKVMAGAIAIGALCVGCPAVLVEPQLLGTMTTGICQLAGAGDQATGIASMVVGIAAAVTVGIVMAVMSFGASSATTAVDVSVKVANVAVGAGAQIAGGATAVATGAVNIEKAGLERAAQNVLADKSDLAAVMVKLQKMMEDGREDIKNIIQQIEDSMTAVTQMINGAADSMAQITSNIGKQRQTI